MSETIEVTKEPITDRLEKVFFQSLDMLDLQTQERHLLAKEKEELGKLIQLLIIQTKEIGQYEAGIRKRIQDCIKESSTIAMQSIEEAVSRKSLMLIEQSNSEVKKVCNSLEEIILELRKEKPSITWKIISSAILSAGTAGLLIAWFIMPKPVLPLTGEQLSYLQEGQMLVQIWPKLTKDEKEKLKTISYEILRSNK